MAWYYLIVLINQWASTGIVVIIISIDKASYENSLLVKFLPALVMIKLGGPRYVSIHMICSAVSCCFC